MYKIYSSSICKGLRKGIVLVSLTGGINFSLSLATEIKEDKVSSSSSAIGRPVEEKTLFRVGVPPLILTGKEQGEGSHAHAAPSEEELVNEKNLVLPEAFLEARGTSEDGSQLGKDSYENEKKQEEAEELSPRFPFGEPAEESKDKGGLEESEEVHRALKIYKNALACEKEENFEEAAELYKEAANHYAAAQYRLGCLYENGRGVEKDEKKALDCYERGARKNNAYAQYRLARLYAAQGKLQEAIEEYHKAARQDISHAQYHLGRLYQKGCKGVEKDEKKALKYYKKAEEQENILASYALARMYERKEDQQSQDEARNYYEKAAKQGHAGASYRLGLLSEFIDLKKLEAADHYLEAASKGHTKAQFYLAWLYAHTKKFPQGVPWKKGHPASEEGRAQKARELYKKAAKKGFARAQNNLGWMYETGTGGNKDLKEAKKWYEKAKENNHAPAVAQANFDNIKIKRQCLLM